MTYFIRLVFFILLTLAFITVNAQIPYPKFFPEQEAFKAAGVKMMESYAQYGDALPALASRTYFDREGYEMTNVSFTYSPFDSTVTAREEGGNTVSKHHYKLTSYDDGQMEVSFSGTRVIRTFPWGKEIWYDKNLENKDSAWVMGDTAFRLIRYGYAGSRWAERNEKSISKNGEMNIVLSRSVQPADKDFPDVQLQRLDCSIYQLSGGKESAKYTCDMEGVFPEHIREMLRQDSLKMTEEYVWQDTTELIKWMMYGYFIAGQAAENWLWNHPESIRAGKKEYEAFYEDDHLVKIVYYNEESGEVTSEETYTYEQLSGKLIESTSQGFTTDDDGYLRRKYFYNSKGLLEKEEVWDRTKITFLEMYKYTYFD